MVTPRSSGRGNPAVWQDYHHSRCFRRPDNRSSFKKAWSIEEAVREIGECAGTHFDPGLIETFNVVLSEIQIIKEQYTYKHGALNDLDFIKSVG